MITLTLIRHRYKFADLTDKESSCSLRLRSEPCKHRRIDIGLDASHCLVAFGHHDTWFDVVEVDGFERNCSFEKLHHAREDDFVLVRVEGTGREDDCSSWLGCFNRRDEQLELRSCDLVDLFLLPEGEGVVGLESRSLSATWRVDQDVIEELWKVVSEHSSVELRDR